MASHLLFDHFGSQNERQERKATLKLLHMSRRGINHSKVRGFQQIHGHLDSGISSLTIQLDKSSGRSSCKS